MHWKTKKYAFGEISPMFVYTFSPSALKNNIIDVKMLAAGTGKKMAPSAKFPPMFVYTFCPYPPTG